MTRTAIISVVAAAVAALGLGAGAAAAAPAAATAKTVNIVMHDPGCHTFAVGTAFKSSLSVKGATTFKNLDEATLIFKGKGFSKQLPVGKTLTIAKSGAYTITMVGQASDDNHLKLTVA